MLIILIFAPECGSITESSTLNYAHSKVSILVHNTMNFAPKRMVQALRQYH